MKCDFLIVGAGFSGSVLAERIANDLKKDVIIIEKRNHIGGNCYDEFDEHGIFIHRYGPHLFHTNNKEIVDYLSQFTNWYEYQHRVLAYSKGEYYPIPINKETINRVYKINLRNEEEVKAFLDNIREKRFPIKNSEDIIVNQLGLELFERFFKYFTYKQWNYYPQDLSPSVCGRIPVRYDSDDRYFQDKFQILPEDGFTKMFEKILNNNRISLILGHDFKKIINSINHKYLIYTGPIDYFFDYKFGKLPYRSIEFRFQNFKLESYQPAPVVNYVDKEVPYTRATEYKKITGQKSNSTTVSFEYPNSGEEPYYPILNDVNFALFKKYESEAKKCRNLILCGRLAEYRYYNMDQVVARALHTYKTIINHL